jgi:signal transduction histidine kinase
LRHAKANELEVYLKIVGQSILLRVIDDGVGFEALKLIILVDPPTPAIRSRMLRNP